MQQQIPPVRLFVDPDGAVPPYTVIKGPHGWYGFPGMRKGQFLTDDDVSGPEWVPLQPGPSCLVEIGFEHETTEGAVPSAKYGVDINYQRAVVGASPAVAGLYILSAAIQKAGEPVMVIATQKPAPVVEEVELAPVQPPRLKLVDTDGKQV